MCKNVSDIKLLHPKSRLKRVTSEIHKQKQVKMHVVVDECKEINTSSIKNTLLHILMHNYCLFAEFNILGKK